MRKPRNDTTYDHEAESPGVYFEANNDGTINATLTCYRFKVGGSEEEIILRFRRLSVETVACIGNSARATIDNAGRKFWARTVQAIKRVKGEE